MIDLKTRNKIAQIIVNMQLLETKPIRNHEMIDVIKEVNNTALIGHALRFVKNSQGVITHIKKYRKTEIEKRIEREKIERLRDGESKKM